MLLVYTSGMPTIVIAVPGAVEFTGVDLATGLVDFGVILASMNNEIYITNVAYVTIGAAHTFQWFHQDPNTPANRIPWIGSPVDAKTTYSVSTFHSVQVGREGAVGDNDGLIWPESFTTTGKTDDGFMTLSYSHSADKALSK